MRFMATAVVISVCAIAVVACSGSRADYGPLDAAGMVPALPAPADINPHSTSALTAALTGSSFETDGLAPRFVSVAGSRALFEPPGEDSGFGYAMYAFELTDYSGEQSLTTAWTTGPTIPDRLWIALSNWDLDAWVWFAATPDSELVIPDITQFMNEADRLLAVVLVSATGANNLDLLYFTEFPPVINSVSPTTGGSGVERMFSVDADGLQPFTYVWDFGSGAVPNISGEMNPTVTLGAPGTYNASVLITNYFGSDSLLFELQVEEIFEPGVGQIVAAAESATASVGESVRIVVASGDLVSPFKYLNGVAVTAEEGAEYVAHSFNVGSPGGMQKEVDGIWTSVNPSTFLLPDDDLIKEAVVVEEPDRIFIAFSVIPIGGADTTTGGDLFNFEMQFNAAGTYTLGFIQYQSVKRTYYSDSALTEFYWTDLSNFGVANTIIVSE